MKTSLILFSLFIFTISLEPESYDDLDIDISKFIIANKTNQIILIIPSNYSTSSAKFYLYIKKENKWIKNKEIDAYIGFKGLGKEKEGDKKTPVGIYQFNEYFGIYDNPGTELPYIKVNKSHYWDGDNNSDRYNQLVNIETYTNFNVDNSEHLIDINPGYEYAMNINYNKEGIKGKGSAIFLHCFTKNTFTEGCVAINRIHLKEIYQIINKDCYIIIDTKENMSKYYEEDSDWYSYLIIAAIIMLFIFFSFA